VVAININILRDICHDNKIKWTLHALERIRERGISFNAVVNTILHGEVITYYHDDNPFPSCLIFNSDIGSPLHVVASTDGKTVYIITAYIPTFDEWECDYKIRKEWK